MPVVHSSASVFRTEGVLTGHGPSSNVSTTSLSVRKSSCLKCSKPKPGPPVVSTSTTRETPRAFGLAHVLLGCGGLSGWAAVTATSPGAGLAEPVSASRSAGGAMTVAGAASSRRGELVQYHTAAITTAVKTLASIRPNALRIVSLPEQ